MLNSWLQKKLAPYPNGKRHMAMGEASMQRTRS
jgi:hypothetical protein